ncbi:TolC family protein [Luteithermobacter gelatinilyticus]|uniref:TolC family protein n=1 Tax=Luteithermobacter gelatinilyticus TaxID=2582913 RepID=UPI0011067C5E|nr:TolC family protein [Luteithermobacter gelatinilyticus]
MIRLQTALLSAFFASILLVGLPAFVLAETTKHIDPALRKFAVQILTEHPAIRAAESEVESAKAHARVQEQPLYNPELEIGYEDVGDEEKTKKLGLSQTIDLWGKRSARYGVAEAELSAANARLAIARKTLLADLLKALSGYEAAKSTLAIASKRVSLNQEFVELAERRYEAGDLTQSDFLTAKLTFAEARAAESAAMADFSRREEQLLAITGGKLPPALLSESPPFEDTPSPETIVVETLPELQVSSAEVKAARSRVRVARKNRYPDPTLGFSIGEQETFEPLMPKNSQTVIGLRLSIPLPVRNTYNAEVDVASADAITLEQNWRNLRRQIAARLEASHKRYMTARTAWAKWEQQGAVLLEEQRTLLQRLFESGEINAVDYIVQLDQTFATESAGIELRDQLWVTWFDWLEASASLGEWMEN